MVNVTKPTNIESNTLREFKNDKTNLVYRKNIIYDIWPFLTAFGDDISLSVNCFYHLKRFYKRLANKVCKVRNTTEGSSNNHRNL